MDRVTKLNVNEVMEDRFGEYAKYIIQDRAIPDVRDGLKPVQRRILYAMNKEGNTYNQKYRKSAKSVGVVMGNYHPHGDSSIYGALARMAQDWLVGVPFIDMQGNKGSIDGDSPAAMRYTEARLQKIVTDAVVEGINKKGVVPMTPTFDDEAVEPVVLPVKFPNILVNGASGISAGYATEIVPHNLAELLKGLVLLEENADVTTSELMQIIPAPDFPTGGVVVGAKHLLSVMETGRGRVAVRCKYHVEKDADKGRKKAKNQYIVIDEIPYGVNKLKLVAKIDEIINTDNKSEKIVGLKDVKDHSGRGVLEIRITCDIDADINTILGILFKKTDLQVNISVNQTVIRNKKPVVLGLKGILEAFNNYRKEIRRKELEYDVANYRRQLHIVEGFIKLSDIINEVVDVIKQSNGKADAEKALVSEFEFSKEQASAIVVMQLHRISKTDKKKYVTEKAKLEKLIKKIDSILTSPKKFSALIIKEYLDLVEQYGTERKTEVIMEDENWEVSREDTIVEEDTHVGITKLGYIKRSTPRSYDSTDNDTMDLLDEDELIFEAKTTTKQFVLLFTSDNNYAYLPVNEIKEARWKAKGDHLGKLLKLGEGVRVVSAYIINPDEDANKDIITIKSNGVVKRTEVKSHVVTKKYWNLYTAIKQKDDEELLDAILLDEGEKGFIGFADSQGKKMYFDTAEISATGLKTAGVRGIHINDKEKEKVSDYMFSVDKEKIEFNGYKYRERGSKGWSK